RAMNPLKRLPLLLPLLWLCATTAGTPCRAQEPSSEGKSLSEWVKLLKGGDFGERQKAALALGKMGPKAKAAVPALIDALKDKKDRVRRFSAKALGDVGPEAKAAVPALIEALRDDQVRAMAGYALKRIDPEAAKKAG